MASHDMVMHCTVHNEQVAYLEVATLYILMQHTISVVCKRASLYGMATIMMQQQK